MVCGQQFLYCIWPIRYLAWDLLPAGGSEGKGSSGDRVMDILRCGCAGLYALWQKFGHALIYLGAQWRTESGDSGNTDQHLHCCGNWSAFIHRLSEAEWICAAAYDGSYSGGSNHDPRKRGKSQSTGIQHERGYGRRSGDAQLYHE